MFVGDKRLSEVEEIPHFDEVVLKNEELNNLFHSSYENACIYLQKKYGIPAGDYFLTSECNSVNSKIKRGKEGLFLHHIYEYNKECPNINNLSVAKNAKEYSFEFQKGENLCYCNYMEHFILHLKIFEMRIYSSRDVLFRVLFRDGVVNHLVPKLNDIYYNECTNKASWHQVAVSLIKDDRQDYFALRDNVLEKTLKKFGNVMTGETRWLTESKLYKF